MHIEFLLNVYKLNKIITCEIPVKDDGERLRSSPGVLSGGGGMYS